MYTVAFEGLKDQSAAIDRLRRRLNTDRSGVLQAIGNNILARGRADFQVKSQGGTGSDGITWRRLNPNTALRKGTPTIGVLTGQLIDPANSEVSVKGNTVYAQIGANLPYTWVFNAMRPIFPKVLPVAWRSAEERLVTAWGQPILEQELGT